MLLFLTISDILFALLLNILQIYFASTVKETHLHSDMFTYMFNTDAPYSLDNERSRLLLQLSVSGSRYQSVLISILLVQFFTNSTHVK